MRATTLSAHICFDVQWREAAELMRQAEKDGVRAYLEKPNVRHRPNSSSVLEKSPEAALDVDQTIFVVVAEDVERSKTTVLWAARNFSSKKICLLYVHRPARPASCSENLLLLFLFDLTVLW
ncbi:hypothetical protein YC2023_023975 [Brassica napus]